MWGRCFSILAWFGIGTLGASPRLITAQCQQCHGVQTQMAGVRLTSSEEVLRNRERILAALTYTGKIKMPPSGALTAAEVKLVRDWIDAGAPWTPTAGPTATWWAFRKPERPALPPSTSGTRNEVDRFLAATLAAKQLTPATEADRATLIRRATYVLHGLPPAFEQVREFEADPHPDAYERLVDRLLESPRFGEKWGKHWLDLVRYGDTSGFEQDPYLLYAWRYRDYVIDSFNRDKPYDRFVKEQIAGDEIYPDDPESRQGAGYFTVGTNRDMLFKVEDVNRVEQLTDFVDTTASVFLGLTAGCARCHDHKFDPVPQRDYYRLQAIFAPAVKSRVFRHYDMARVYDLAENTRTFRLYEIGAQLMALMDPYRKAIRDERLRELGPAAVEAFATPDDKKTPEQKALFEMYAKKVEPSDEQIYARMSKDELERLHKVERRLVSTFKTYAPGPFSPGVNDAGREAPRTFLPGPGGQPGEEVRPGFPGALGGGEIPDPPLHAETTFRRKALAEWIASPAHPLTARVMVNRIWQFVFGRGIVSTPSDFGTRAAAPTHPELLEWLAMEFTARNWSVKEMVRLMMRSAAFRQSAKASRRAVESDPENQWLSHFTRRRLEAEEIRDAALKSAGVLSAKMGGRPVVPPLETEELYGMSQPLGNAWIVTEDPQEHVRRSIYMISRRNFRMPLLEAFDRPEGVLSCSRRDSSTTAPQSLSLLNGRFTMEQARRIASAAKGSTDPVAEVWKRVLARDPRESEAATAREFLSKQERTLGSAEPALAELARALLNINEFLYVD
ncbi:MAG: DUF1553 domain-containing protein [Acidobacteria bacterium]|nr:DUF1553 domain-containing protein [Acidobacteriota bacterium]